MIAAAATVVSHGTTVVSHSIWSAPWVVAMTTGIILSIALAVGIIIFACSCYDGRSEWPWVSWQKHRREMQKMKLAEQIAARAHEEKMEQIRMGLLKE